jgi:hypothetical protein
MDYSQGANWRQDSGGSVGNEYKHVRVEPGAKAHLGNSYNIGVQVTTTLGASTD